MQMIFQLAIYNIWYGKLYKLHIVTFGKITFCNVMCTTHYIGRLISVPCQKECSESKKGRTDRQTDTVIIVHTCGSCKMSIPTILPAKSDSDAMFRLQSYQGLRIDRSLVY